MPIERGRTKKLILALHYYKGGTAGWRCEDCRRQGLEERRRCGWRESGEGNAQAIWVGRGSSASRCPKTVITADSVAWLEMWTGWRLAGRAPEACWSAKDLEAMGTLENEWERMLDEERRSRL